MLAATLALADLRRCSQLEILTPTHALHPRLDLASPASLQQFEPYDLMPFLADDLRAVAAACPALAHLYLEAFSLSGSWEGVVLQHLTRLEVAICAVEVDEVDEEEDEDEWAAWPGAPLLHAAAPRLAALDMRCSSASAAAALLDLRLTTLTHIGLAADIFEDGGDGGELDTQDALRKVERLAPASLGIRLASAHAPEGDEALRGRVRPALAWLYDCAVGLSTSGALQLLAVHLDVVPVPVHMLLPALAPLGGSLRELELRG